MFNISPAPAALAKRVGQGHVLALASCSLRIRWSQRITPRVPKTIHSAVRRPPPKTSRFTKLWKRYKTHNGSRHTDSRERSFPLLSLTSCSLLKRHLRTAKFLDRSRPSGGARSHLLFEGDAAVGCFVC